MKYDHIYTKMKHIYTEPQFNNSFFTYPKLYSEMVKRFPNNSTFIEIGSWKGQSAAYMVVEIINSKKDIKFICVDTWNGSIEHQSYDEISDLYNIFKNNMSPFKSYYTDLRLPSVEASKLFNDNSIDFIFIDASHEYEDVKNDIIHWLPKVKKNGILSGHDYWADSDSWPGVKKAVNELLKNTKHTNEGCWIYEVL